MASGCILTMATFRWAAATGIPAWSNPTQTVSDLRRPSWHSAPEESLRFLTQETWGHRHHLNAGEWVAVLIQNNSGDGNSYNCKRKVRSFRTWPAVSWMIAGGRRKVVCAVCGPLIPFLRLPATDSGRTEDSRKKTVHSRPSRQPHPVAAPQRLRA